MTSTDPERLGIFISWSGMRSQAMAEALHDWLPLVVQRFEPWASFDGIEKGAPWLEVIRDQLEVHHVGILCITPENRERPWILYEAGALTKLGKSRVCPLVIRGMKVTELGYPLAGLNACTLDKLEMRKLVGGFNLHLGRNKLDERVLARSFEKHWPDFEQAIAAIPPATEPEPEPRKAEDKLDEILGFVRGVMRNSTPRVLTTQLENERRRFVQPEVEIMIVVETDGFELMVSRNGQDLIDTRVSSASALNSVLQRNLTHLANAAGYRVVLQDPSGGTHERAFSAASDALAWLAGGLAGMKA